jgi:SAM-dependent methyltransferase
MHSATKRIVSLSMVKNEQDIIEPFVRHTRKFVNAMVVLDNDSTDATRQILIKLNRELRGVFVTDAPGLAYRQGERMTSLLNYVQTAFFADYIMMLDADEFIQAKDPEHLLRELARIPAGGQGFIKWRTFVHTPHGEQSYIDPPQCFRWCRAEERPSYSKTVLRQDGLYFHDLRLGQGSHGLDAPERAIPTIHLDGLRIDHFPVRSPSQLVSKSVVGWAAIVALPDDARDLSWSYQWAQNFARIRDGHRFTAEEVAREAFSYAQDDHAGDWGQAVLPAEPPSYERRYSDGSFADPISVLASAWERSLRPKTFTTLYERPVDLGREVSSTTSFDPSWHWENFYLDIPPFAYLAETFRPKRVGDFGCGTGAYLNIFKETCGASIAGYDGIPAQATVLSPEEYQQVDLAAALPINTTFDLSLCVEVVEHMADADAERLLVTIANATIGVIVFSAAEPGQPGNGHINCRKLAEWLDRWAILGWHPDLIESLGLRALSTLSWLRRNLVVLTRQQNPGPDAQALVQIARRKHVWYNQDRGVRRYAFCDPLPGPPLGYQSTAPLLKGARTFLVTEEACRMIAALDIDVFRVNTQTSSRDRTSLLRVQNLARSMPGGYVYLEVGSHLGGSLFPHLIDSACTAAISIDPRFLAQPDERAEIFPSEDNSTAQMMAVLSAQLPPDTLAKLVTIDSDVSDLQSGALETKATLALIDGKHTNAACFSDFVGLMPLMNTDCIVSFHDSNLIADAICNAERFLEHLGIRYKTVFLPDTVAVMGLGAFASIVLDKLGAAGFERTAFLDLSRRQVWSHIAHVHSPELSAEVDTLRCDNARLAQECKRLEEARRDVETRFAAITASTIWRASAPVRRVVDLVKRRIVRRM